MYVAPGRYLNVIEGFDWNTCQKKAPLGPVESIPNFSALVEAYRSWRARNKVTQTLKNISQATQLHIPITLTKEWKGKEMNRKQNFLYIGKK
jgi:hypothetical protein